MPLCCDVFLCCGDGDPLIAHISIRHKKSDPLALWIGFFPNLLLISVFIPPDDHIQNKRYKPEYNITGKHHDLRFSSNDHPYKISGKNPAIRTIDKRFLIPRISYSRYSTAQAAIYFQRYRNAARYCPFIYTPLYTAWLRIRRIRFLG